MRRGQEETEERGGMSGGVQRSKGSRREGGREGGGAEGRSEGNRWVEES